MSAVGAQPRPGADASAVGGTETAPAQVPLDESALGITTKVTAKELDPIEMGNVITGLKRAQGQLDDVLAMLEAGRGCEDIVTELSAVSRAMDRAGFAIIATSMKQCLVESDGAQTLPMLQLQKLFLSLA